MIKSARPTFTEHDRDEITMAVNKILRSGRMILGPYTEHVELEFAKLIGVKHAIAVSSCSAALEIALRWRLVPARSIQKPPLVLVPANTFAATAMVPLRLGHRVEFVDMSSKGVLNVGVDLFAMEQTALEHHAAAVIVVHLAGQIDPEFPAFAAHMHALGVAVIEDCAHAHRAYLVGSDPSHPGVPDRVLFAGSIGDAGCWSFYATKVLTAGTGGMITTNDDGLDQFARKVRHHGGRTLDNLTEIGSDFLMNEITAAVLCVQLKRLDTLHAARARVAQHYARLFADDPRVLVPAPLAFSQSAYYKQPLYLDDTPDDAGVSPPVNRIRNALLEYLFRNDIEAGVLYSPLAYEQPAIADHPRASRPDCPHARAAVDRQICLPMHASLTETDVETIARCTRRGLDVVTGKFNALSRQPPPLAGRRAQIIRAPRAGTVRPSAISGVVFESVDAHGRPTGALAVHVNAGDMIAVVFDSAQCAFEFDPSRALEVIIADDSI